MIILQKIQEICITDDNLFIVRDNLCKISMQDLNELIGKQEKDTKDKTGKKKNSRKKKKQKKKMQNAANILQDNETTNAKKYVSPS